jgi:hypothetical protein
LPILTRSDARKSPSKELAAITRIRSMIAGYRGDGVRISNLSRRLTGSIEKQYVNDVVDILIRDGNVLEMTTTPKGGGHPSRVLWTEEFAPVYVPRKYDCAPVVYPEIDDLDDGDEEPDPHPLEPVYANNNTAKYVYVLSCTDGGSPLCKIGIANRPWKRLEELSTGSPHKIRMDFTIWHPHAVEIERLAHRDLRPFRRNGEWFAVPPMKAIKCIFSLVARLPVIEPNGKTMCGENPLEPAVFAF